MDQLEFDRRQKVPTSLVRDLGITGGEVLLQSGQVALRLRHTLTARIT
jgi:hypothetical protein